jgi:hypothetical protein
VSVRSFPCQFSVNAGPTWSRYEAVSSRIAATLRSSPAIHSRPVSRITPPNTATTAAAGIGVHVEALALGDHPREFLLQSLLAAQVGGEQRGRRLDQLEGAHVQFERDDGLDGLADGVPALHDGPAQRLQRGLVGGRARTASTKCDSAISWTAKAASSLPAK